MAQSERAVKAWMLPPLEGCSTRREEGEERGRGGAEALAASLCAASMTTSVTWCASRRGGEKAPPKLFCA